MCLFNFFSFGGKFCWLFGVVYHYNYFNLTSSSKCDMIYKPLIYLIIVAFFSFYTGIAKHFRYGSQEDAHEFLRYTVDAMQKSCLPGAKYVSFISKTMQGLA